MPAAGCAEQRSIATLLCGCNKLFLNFVEALECVLSKWDFGVASLELQREKENFLQDVGELIGKELNAVGLRRVLIDAGHPSLAREVTDSNVARRVAAHPKAGLRRRVVSALQNSLFTSDLANFTAADPLQASDPWAGQPSSRDVPKEWRPTAQSLWANWRPSAAFAAASGQGGVSIDSASVIVDSERASVVPSVEAEVSDGDSQALAEKFDQSSEQSGSGADPFVVGSVVTSLSGSSASKCVIHGRDVWIQPPFTVAETAELQVLVRGRDLNSDRMAEGWINKSRLCPLEPG